jgi:hypothetical protein
MIIFGCIPVGNILTASVVNDESFNPHNNSQEKFGSQ